jgi:hypothetical protein
VTSVVQFKPAAIRELDAMLDRLQELADQMGRQTANLRFEIFKNRLAISRMKAVDVRRHPQSARSVQDHREARHIGNG